MGDLARLRDQSGAGDPGAELVPESQTPNLYCLSQKHSPSLLTEERFFFWDLGQPGCPICPVCKIEVEAQFVGYNAKGQPQIPANLLALQQRIGERV